MFRKRGVRRGADCEVRSTRQRSAADHGK